MNELTHKGYVLLTTEIPNFGHTGVLRDDKLYRGSSIINDEKWVRDASSVELLVEWFKSRIDNLGKPMNYEQVFHAWNGDSKKVVYKDKVMWVYARKRSKDERVVYLGKFYDKDGYLGKERTRESIHYDKVVKKFREFVDEYCTDWRTSSSIPYKGYMLWIDEECGGEAFFGSCQIHENSVFKCISNSYREIEDKFIARIDQIIEHKEKINPKTEKLKQLEDQIAKLQQELEKIKNEKEVFTYKGVTLEYGKEEGLPEGYLIGKIKNAPEGTKEFKRKVISNMQCDFEEYIDELEKFAKLYSQLIGKQL